MVFALPAIPAALAGIGSALSNPTFLSIVGSLLPSVVSALTGSPTEEEAKAKFAPKRDEMLGELIKAGMHPPEAEQLADKAIAEDVNGAMNSGGIPLWLEGALSVAGGLGGWKAGSWLKGRGAKAATAAPAAAAAATPTVPTKVAESPFTDVNTSGATHEIDPLRDPHRTMLGRTTEQRTLTPDEMPTAPIPEMGSPFIAAKKGSPWSWKGEAEDAPMFFDTDTPAVPACPVSAPAPDVAEPGRDPMGWADKAAAERLAAVPERINSPFAWADDAANSGAAAQRFGESEAAARRAALDEIAAAEAATKQRQIEAMREHDDRKKMGLRIRGGLTEGMQTQAGNT